MSVDSRDETATDESPKPGRVIIRRKADASAGLLLAAVGALVLTQAVHSRPGLSERLDPRTVPVLLASALLVAGIVLAVGALRYSDRAGVLDWPTQRGWTRVTLATLSFCAYAQTVAGFGLAVATAVFVAGLEWALDRGSVVKALIWGVVSGIVSSIVFLALLDVQLPAGPLDTLLASLVGR